MTTLQQAHARRLAFNLRANIAIHSNDHSYQLVNGKVIHYHMSYTYGYMYNNYIEEQVLSFNEIRSLLKGTILHS